VEVCAWRGVYLYLIPFFPKTDKNLLGEVFRDSSLSYNSVNGSTNSLIVRIKEFFEHSFVIAAKPGSQVQYSGLCEAWLDYEKSVPFANLLAMIGNISQGL
jgi:hypothetical protein